MKQPVLFFGLWAMLFLAAFDCGESLWAQKVAVAAASPGVPALAFPEIWAYVMEDQQAAARPDLPITDLAYFAAGLSNRGELVGVPIIQNAQKIVARKHLVLAELDGSAGLMHFVLAPEFPMRDKLIADLVVALAPFDGIQIDFENLMNYDAENFRQFLLKLKTAIGGKTLSVALPARNSPVSDAFSYPEIVAIADRILIMAYDQHWSGSEPGSIASLAWCKGLASYALGTMGPDKLIMGLPFYGRAWSNKNPAGAYRFPSLERLRKEKSPQQSRHFF